MDHAAYTRALAALKVEPDHLISHVTNAPGVARRSLALGLSSGTDCRIGCAKPDKCGTVRSIGTRFSRDVIRRPKRFAAV